MIRAAICLLLTLGACTTVAAPPPPAGRTRIAVAFDRSGEIAARADGLADPATGRLATPDDPVRIASISKLVVALGVMRMVEASALDLDRPVGDYLGYKVENPAFPGQKVTLRRLLSHTASLRDHDDQYAIPLGETLRAVLADPASWESSHGPDAGTFTYGNVNFPVVASVIERISGTRFDRMMKRLVLDPLRIDACFNWPTCGDAAVARAIVLTQDGKAVRDDLGGKQPACPVFVRDGRTCDLDRFVPGENGALFSPQGGLRISARGLMRIGRMLIGEGTIDGTRFLSPASVALMTTPRWTFDGRNGDTDQGFFCRYGLAVQTLATPVAGCRDDPERRGRGWIGHAGEAYGVRSGLWIDRERGVGIAYFVTGLDADTAPGRTAFRAAEERAFDDAVRLLGKVSR